MQVQVLGCSGAIAQQARTTSFLIDGRILVDAGTGVGDLSVAAMLQIEHVFLTHAHLDHIAALPLMIGGRGRAHVAVVAVEQGVERGVVRGRVETVTANEGHAFFVEGEAVERQAHAV